MGRQGGHYGGDSGGRGRGDGGGRHSYGGSAAQMHHQQQHNSKSEYYQGLQQEQQTIGENERGPQHDNQWRWERDGAQDKLPQTAMSPTAPFSEGRDAPRSYYQIQRLEPRMSMERHGGGDPRSHRNEENMDIGYEDNRAIQSFEGLEQRFLDDILKMSKEQTDAEDAENARHKERINAINAQYEEQLLDLRARHASRRDEILRRESQARKQQYQQMVLEPYATNNIDPSDPRGYNPAAASAREPLHSYNNPESYNSYSEGTRLPSISRDHSYSNARDQGYESKVPYPKGSAYDSCSRYY